MSHLDKLAEDANPLKKIYDDIEDNVMDVAMQIDDWLGVNKKSKVKKSSGQNIRSKFKRPISLPDAINKKKNNNSVPNIHRSISTGLHGQDNKMSGEEEIPVAKIPKALSSIVPDYFTVKLPARTIDKLLVITGTNTYDSVRITLNDLNSPFSNATTIDYLGTAQWKSLFQYYRIVSNDISIFVTNMTADHSTFIKGGDFITEAIARVGMEYTDSATARLDTARKQVEGKHNVTTTIQAAGLPNGSGCTHHFKHHYRPADFVQTNSHITETGDEDRWTAIAAGPTHPHYIHLGLNVAHENQFAATGGEIACLVEIKNTITVQFREVTDAILTTSQTS